MNQNHSLIDRSSSGEQLHVKRREVCESVVYTMRVMAHDVHVECARAHMSLLWASA
jgi:hypothetical protein